MGKKIGPPKDRGFGSIRPLTRREQQLTKLTPKWCIGRDADGILRFYAKNGAGYDFGYVPYLYEKRIKTLTCFWEGEFNDSPLPWN